MNFKHLHYFWTVARLGSIAAGAEHLDLAPQTVSAQIKLLEAELGTQLFQAQGRGLALTEAGRLALHYADEIFSLGDALEGALARQTRARGRPFRVGVADAVSKTIAYRLLEPAMRLPEPIRLVCREGRLDVLLTELALNRLEAVIGDRPLPSQLGIRGFSHLLGESDTAFFAAAALAADAGAFPACLAGLALLLPGTESVERMRVEQWLENERLSPRIAGEFEDGALMKAFGKAGVGVFPAPAVIAAEVCAQYAVIEIGRTPKLRSAFYVITAERRISHPATRAITEGDLFAQGSQ